MSDKPPRLQPHTMQPLGETGARMYHINPHLREYQSRLGKLALVDPNEPEKGWKMSLTDGVPVPVEPPDTAA